MTDLLPHLEVIHSPSGKTPDAAVIWLHGLGADGHDFEPIVPELRLPEDMAVRFIFPHAPVRPVTINMGMEMRSWYDIQSISEMRQIDEGQLRESCVRLGDLIANEIGRGIASQRIIIAGFSQGGAVTLNTALCYDQPLGGIVALSTYLPAPQWVEQHRTAQNQAVPVIMAHGTQDNVVPFALAARGRQQLDDMGYAVEWHEYPMPHAVCPEEIGAIAAFLLKHLQASADS